MTPRSELELSGNFFTHPFAELLAEIAKAGLNGSLRAFDKEKKCVIYFKAGRIVFAVSNSRSSRLFEVLISRGRLTKPDLLAIPNYANDLELAAILQDRKLLTKEEIDGFVSQQIEAIIVEVLTWAGGDWTFSALARVRDGLSFKVNTTQLLIDYARCMPIENMLKRFRSLDEVFSRSPGRAIEFSLTPGEAFVQSRADDGPLTATDLISVAAIPEADALHSIYTLWLGGLLVRNSWQPAFSELAIGAMRRTKLELKREAKHREAISDEAPIVPTEPAIANAAAPPKEADVTISLEEYLERVEGAETYYDILGVDAKADVEELKRAYFGLAKAFHPDRYHAGGGETLRRIQHAFRELAQAHETVKNTETREIYDYRMRKELADREKRLAGGPEVVGSMRLEQAAENFDRGLDLIMDGDPEGAVELLARAVHFAPKNARYHAYYGKALSTDEKHRHKAEAEIQAALKLDPDNPTFRILLAEFFIQFNLLKRAEGELKRLLAVFPSNREARDLLDSLPK